VAYDVPPVTDSQALVYIGTDNAQQRLAGFQAATADVAIEPLPPCVDNHDTERP
jgi:hypothetical protein